MTRVSPSVLFALFDALEALEDAHEAFLGDPGDVPGDMVEEAISALLVVMASVEPDPDRLAQALFGILEDD